jgi:hypothetical protein
MPETLHSPADGATPLTPDERDGLIPTFIATREDLNAAEQDDITEAILRLRRRRLTSAPDLTQHAGTWSRGGLDPGDIN